MKYIIMAGGVYKEFGFPKAWQIINGERLINRTIRLLHEAGVEQVYISSLDPRFDECDAIRLEHKNDFVLDENGNVIKGWWLDAYYPSTEPVCYLHGDVWFTPETIRTIVNYQSDRNIFFGTESARNPQHLPWGEPFGFKVFNPEEFFAAIEAVKKLHLEGKTIRHPISWEVYRYMNGLDINRQEVTDTYVGFTDQTIDYDHPVKI